MLTNITEPHQGEKTHQGSVYRVICESTIRHKKSKTLPKGLSESSHTQTVQLLACKVEEFLHVSSHKFLPAQKCPSFSMTCMSPTEHLWDALDWRIQQCTPTPTPFFHSCRRKVGQHSTAHNQLDQLWEKEIWFCPVNPFTLTDLCLHLSWVKS